MSGYGRQLRTLVPTCTWYRKHQGVGPAGWGKIGTTGKGSTVGDGRLQEKKGPAKLENSGAVRKANSDSFLVDEKSETRLDGLLGSESVKRKPFIDSGES